MRNLFGTEIKARVGARVNRSRPLIRNMLLVARVVVQSALRRTESRGAQRREDFKDTAPEWNVNQSQ
jgi:succinate dehydrogenase/fumarate reductase flavoprotein subunit